MVWILLAPTIMQAAVLPSGGAPTPVVCPHFPDRLHAFVWRNWPLVPAERMAEVVGAGPEDIRAIGKSMGLDGPPKITDDQWRRSYITIIRRNWHLLPYEQLLTLLGWSAEELAFCLREDDFLFIKLGNLKPACEPLTFAPPSDEAAARARAIAAVAAKAFPEGVGTTEEPLFHFVAELSKKAEAPALDEEDSLFSPRYCYSYFALYGDPLMEKDIDPFPEGYLARLAASGVNGVWLQAVLYKLTPFPWDTAKSADHLQRLENLGALVARAKKCGIGVYLYLNEPRSMPLAFFEAHPELKGVVEGDYAAMCTSAPEVREYITNGVRQICEASPDLAGFFTISGSENLTNCWSHHHGENCPRCTSRPPADVIAEFHAAIQKGIDAAGTKTRLIAWDWGWRDEWLESIVQQLPTSVSLMSVSEWSIPIQRGGIDSVIGEYSISTVGPGPRATRHWGFARDRGLDLLAKIQANNTWELSAVPYVPAVENVAQHAANLREADVDGLMLSWTLGGYPSPNLEVVAEIGKKKAPSVDEALAAVAGRRFGEAGPAVVTAWRAFSAAFREFPYNCGTLYQGPQQMGPANPLWGEPTGYASTMVGFPYDCLKGWCSVYPPEVFIGQFTKMADGFDAAIESLETVTAGMTLSKAQTEMLASELDVARACAIHFRSVANQSLFVLTRDALTSTESAEAAGPLLAKLEETLRSEWVLATRLHAIQSRDSRIGFEASNHYFYVPIDLAEKVVNCEYLLDEWLPKQRSRFADGPQ